MSNLLKDIFKLYKSKHITGSSWHPQTQGSVERQNRTLVETLKHYTLSEVSEWSTYVPHAMAAYNSSVHASTLCTPYELFFGRKMRLPLDAMIHKPEPVYRDIDGYQEETAVRLYSAHQNARHHSAKALQAQAKYYNMRAKKRDFRVGDQVYVTNEAKKGKKKNADDCRKFRYSWNGPCCIITQLSNVVYVIEHLDSGKKETVHENRLKLAFTQPHRQQALDNTEALDPPPLSPTADGKVNTRLRSRATIREREKADWYKVLDNSESSSSDEDSPPIVTETTDSEGSGNSQSDTSSDSEDDSDPPLRQDTAQGSGESEGSDIELEVKDPSSPPEVPLESELKPQLGAPALRDIDLLTPESSTEAKGGHEEIKGGQDAPFPSEDKPVDLNTQSKSGSGTKTKTPTQPSAVKSRLPRPSPVGKLGSPRLDPIDAPLLQKRRDKLTKEFDREWKKKVKYDKKHQSTYRIDLFKVAGRNPSYTIPTKEWEYLEAMKATAEESYEDPSPCREPVRRTGRDKNTVRDGLYHSTLNSDVNTDMYKLDWHRSESYDRGEVLHSRYVQYSLSEKSDKIHPYLVSLSSRLH